MKTRTLVSLVFGLALLGPVRASLGAETILSVKAGGTGETRAATNPVAITTSLPMELPETASVVLWPRPAAALPEGVTLSGWVGELVKLAEAGISHEVMLSFVDSAGTFNLVANEIIYLHDIGMPSEVITAIIQHDADIASGVRLVTAAAPPTPPAFRFPPAPGRGQNSLPPRPGPAAELGAFEPAPAWPVADQLLAGNFQAFDESADPCEFAEVSPVRKPYAVPLTSPILVWPVPGRVPNVTLLRTLP